jgi:hypothetical protein
VIARWATFLALLPVAFWQELRLLLRDEADGTYLPGYGISREEHRRRYRARRAKIR